MTSLTLPPIIDRTTAGALSAQLAQAIARGEPLTISGHDVVRIGQCGLQLIASAQTSARAANMPVTVECSQAMMAAADTAGLREALGWVEQ